MNTLASSITGSCTEGKVQDYITRKECGIISKHAAIILLSCLFFSTVHAQTMELKFDRMRNPYAAGLECMTGKSPNYTAAFNYMLISAKAGFEPAQTMLATMYSKGLGVDMNATEAAKWTKIAAENRATNAQNVLLTKYIRDEGRMQDRTENAKWNYRKTDSKMAIAHDHNGWVAVKQPLTKSAPASTPTIAQEQAITSTPVLVSSTQP